MNRRPWISYVGQVMAGAYAHGLGDFGGQASLSTYGNIPDLLATHAGEIIDGAWVVDARAVSEEDAITEAISGPMPNASLAPHEDEGARALDYVSEKTKAWRWHQLGATVMRWSRRQGHPGVARLAGLGATQRGGRYRALRCLDAVQQPNRRDTMSKQVNIYRNGNEWAYALWIDGEYDSSDTLDAETEAEARGEVAAQFRDAEVERVADTNE